MTDIALVPIEEWHQYPELPPPTQRRALRKSIGLTLDDAASYVGVSEVMFKKYERTSTPRHGTERRRRYSVLLDAISRGCVPADLPRRGVAAEDGTARGGAPESVAAPDFSDEMPDEGRDAVADPRLLDAVERLGLRRDSAA